MKHLSMFALPAALIMLAASCAAPVKTQPAANTGSKSFPVLNQEGKVAIVAHRGFWKSEAGGMSENSIASLKAAQDNGFWGSECDIHITADDVVIVNHNNDIGGKKIASHKFADFANDLLPNGERRPTLDEYLVQAAKSKTTKLIIEFKAQPTDEREALLVDKTMAALKAYGMYDPQQVLFISFSRFICDKVAAEHPAFVNQFLSAQVLKDEKPSRYATRGINGVDYYYKMFDARPEWVQEAHANGKSVNVWTVDDSKDIERMIEIGVDAITSNEPLLVREHLGDKEFKNK